MDGFGVSGTLMHFSLITALVGSALIAFLYFWRRGRLDMDEEPKMQMLEEDV